MNRGVLRLRRAALACCLAVLLPGVALAQAWPTRTVTLVTPLAAGSAADLAVRIVADRLSTVLGQPFVVDNETGASGEIGTQKVARATPDGYTLCGCNNTILGVLPNVRKVGYDPVHSFRPVGTLAVLPTALLVNPGLPVRTVAEFIAYVKAHPGQVNYATGGVGSPQHIAMAMFETAIGGKMTHVPYKGASQAAVGVAAGETNALFVATGTALPLVKSGKLRPIAVAGAQRTPALPELPTVAESGVPGYDYASWIGIVAPTGTPDAVVDKLSAAITQVLAMPETVKRLADNGIDPLSMDARQMGRYMASDFKRMAKVVNDSGMKE